MNESAFINSTTSTSFTENNDMDGRVWFSEDYFLFEDIGNLTLKEEE